MYLGQNSEKYAGSGHLDIFDRKILHELSANGRLPVTELAKRIGLSKTPCQARMKRLQAEGYIKGFRAVLDLEKLGRDHVVFVEVKLVDTCERALAEFNAAALKVPEIEQCHMIAGAFDYLLKVRTRDIKSYRLVLGEVISALPHVGSTSTHVSMQSVKDVAS
jgi:Lrp/AsnC family leucine-responsive transcriptional regulator